MKSLLEDKRSSLMSQGRRGEKEKGTGRSRYEMRVNSKVATTTKEFNDVDMQSLFVHNILTINVPVVGETDNYLVRIKFGGFLDLLQQQVSRQQGVLDLRAITRALLDAFNKEDVYISCTCLHPDTRIKLLDGTSPTVEEMYKRFVSGEKLYCYSVDSKGDFVPGEVEKVWITGDASEFVEVTLDNDEVIRTTPDHLYMLRDGSYVQASDLCVGQSLMPLYFGSTNGYETIRYNSHRGCNSTYKMVATYFKSDEMADAENRASHDDNMPLNEDPEKRKQRALKCAYTKIETVLREMLQNGLPMTEEQYLKSRRSGYPNVLKYFESVEDAVEYFKLNHKIKSIRRIILDTPIKVYDIKMVGEPNFLVDAGVILHNCKDFRYRFGFWTTMRNINSGPPERRPSKITNPKNNLGPGCKHIMLVLSNNSWLIKVARVINNWIIYMSKYRKKQYADIIYPAIYGRSYEEPVQLAIDDEVDINDKSTIDKANELGKTRGQFKTGNKYRFKPRTITNDQINIDDVNIDEK